MLKIGLTGGIGTGKSTVAKVFKSLGIPCFDADNAAKDLMQNNEAVKSALISAFGADTYQHNQLNKTHLAAQVFNDKEKLALLNNITHPATIAAANTWMQMQDAVYIIKEAALLFEADSYKDLDFIIGINAPLALRIERVMKRSKMSRDEVMQRIEKQMNNDEKMKLCHFIIDNDEQKAIIPQVVSLHNKFVALEINKS